MRAMTALAATVLVGLAALTGCATDPPLPGRVGLSLPEAQQAPAAAPLAGYELSIPDLEVRSDLTPLGLNPNRTVQVPPLSDVGQVGLYQPPSGAPRPGDPGPAVLLGHVNGGGQPGVFARLGDLTAGDLVEVATPGGPLRFEVTETLAVGKRQFPTARVYSDTPGPELRLITCGGEFDPATRNYQSNIVVFARQTP